MPKSNVFAPSVATSGATREVGAGPANSPLAQAIRFGNMLFVSGVGGVDGATDTVVSGGVEAQCRMALQNLDAILVAAGANHGHVVNLRLVFRHVADAPRVEAILAQWLGDERVALLCTGSTPNRAGIDLQIECIAMFD